MENIEVVLSLMATVLGLIITVLTVILKFVKNSKAKQVIEQTIEICTELAPMLSTADKDSELAGEDLTQYVTDSIKKFAEENDYEFEEETASKIIEELLKIVKTVKEMGTEKNEAPLSENNQ